MILTKNINKLILYAHHNNYQNVFKVKYQIMPTFGKLRHTLTPAVRHTFKNSVLLLLE